VELKKLLRILRKKRVQIVAGGLIGAILGISAYVFPMDYKAQGSFYIEHPQQKSEDGSFSYEGYYSQQVAISHTKTLAAVIKSPDISKSVIEKSGGEINESSLRRYKKTTKVLKAGPQLITLIISNKHPQRAEELWIKTANVLTDTMTNTQLKITQLSEKPVVVEPYKNLPLFIMLGCVFGLSLSICTISFEEYLKK
jgi:capsular polysaccharide biosynthesis protein